MASHAHGGAAPAVQHNHHLAIWEGEEWSGRTDWIGCGMVGEGTRCGADSPPCPWTHQKYIAGDRPTTTNTPERQKPSMCSSTPALPQAHLLAQQGRQLIHRIQSAAATQPRRRLTCSAPPGALLNWVVIPLCTRETSALVNSSYLRRRNHEKKCKSKCGCRKGEQGADTHDGLRGITLVPHAMTAGSHLTHTTLCMHSRFLSSRAGITAATVRTAQASPAAWPAPRAPAELGARLRQAVVRQGETAAVGKLGAE